MEQCKVIAITNQKGGVGKTTTTVNLGVGLAKHGKRVLLIDADPQGSLTISLGERNPDQLSETLSDVMERIINDKSLPENFGLMRSAEGIDLMPANIELSGTEVGLFNVMSREYVLKTYIDSISKNYDYILIDCMPSLGMMTINALAAADRVIILSIESSTSWVVSFPVSRKNCPTENVASRPSVKGDTPLAPLKRLSPVDLPSANSKFEIIVLIGG